MPPAPRQYPQPSQNNTTLPRRPSLTPSASQLQNQTPPSRPTSQVSSSQEKREETEAVAQKPLPDSVPVVADDEPVEPFVAPIPWLSVPDAPFPPRAHRRRRRIPRSRLHHEPLYFPPESAPVHTASEQHDTEAVPSDALEQQEVAALKPAETPTTIPSDTHSDHMSTQPTTPSSAVTANASKVEQTPTQSKQSRVAMPVLPIVPAIPSSPTANRKAHRDSNVSTLSKLDSETLPVTEEAVKEEEFVLAEPTPPPAPKSWADLVKKQAAANAVASIATPVPVLNGLSAPKTESLGDVLGEINVIESPSKVAFLKPRGLVNTGNMCYMNSVRAISHHHSNIFS